MLRHFTLSSFKSFAGAQLPLSTLTVLVGANASGKSNAIEAIRLLHWLAQGRRLGEIRGAIDRHELGVRGTAESLSAPERGTISLGCEVDVEVPGEVIAHRLRLDLEIRVSAGDLRLADERLFDEAARGDLPLYRVVSPAAPGGGELIIEYNNFARGNKKPQARCLDQQAVFTQLVSPARFRPNHGRAQRLIPRAAQALQSMLEAVLFLDPVPSTMRGYSFKSDLHLRGDGQNLSATLYDLVTQKQMGAEVLAFVRALPEQDVTAIEFVETPRSEVMVRLRESFGGQGRSFDASLLSDGTLRVLAVAAAVLSVPEKSLVVIEELDNGVHPSRARSLLKLILEVAERRRLKLLLTTHNPAMLDGLPDTALPDVVACYRDPTTGVSMLRRLGELSEYPTLIARASLGDLVTRRVLERVLHEQRTEAQSIEAALRYFDERESA